jgi:hypothetical protein
LVSGERSAGGTFRELVPFPMPVPPNTHYRQLGIGPEVTAEEIRAATARQVRRLKAQGAGEDEIAEVNGLGFTSAEQWAAYDAGRPPLELLRLEPCWTSLFDDRAHPRRPRRQQLPFLRWTHTQPAGQQ